MAGGWSEWTQGNWSPHLFFCSLHRWVKQQCEFAKQAQNPDQGPKLDLGFKEGQTIKLSIAVSPVPLMCWPPPQPGPEPVTLFLLVPSARRCLLSRCLVPGAALGCVRGPCCHGAQELSQDGRVQMSGQHGRRGSVTWGCPRCPLSEGHAAQNRGTKGGFLRK